MGLAATTSMLGSQTAAAGNSVFVTGGSITGFGIVRASTMSLDGASIEPGKFVSNSCLRCLSGWSDIDKPNEYGNLTFQVVATTVVSPSRISIKLLGSVVTCQIANINALAPPYDFVFFLGSVTLNANLTVALAFTTAADVPAGATPVTWSSINKGLWAVAVIDSRFLPWLVSCSTVVCAIGCDGNLIRREHALEDSVPNRVLRATLSSIGSTSAPTCSSSLGGDCIGSGTVLVSRENQWSSLSSIGSVSDGAVIGPSYTTLNTCSNGDSTSGLSVLIGSACTTTTGTTCPWRNVLVNGACVAYCLADTRCQVHGTCNTALTPPVCSCEFNAATGFGWSGDYCDVALCAENCNGASHGLCTQPTTGVPSCSCINSWYGTTCAQKDCPGGCNEATGNGQCDLSSGNAVCACTSNANGTYYGVNCESKTVAGGCAPTCAAPSGTCTAGKCVCSSSQWTGSSCTIPVCPGGGSCSGNGECKGLVNGSVACTCSSAYTGIDCGTPRAAGLCSPACENGGTCTTGANNSPVCSCTAGFGGASCTAVAGESSSISAGVWVGVAFGAAILVGLALAASVWLYRKLRIRQSNKEWNEMKKMQSA